MSERAALKNVRRVVIKLGTGVLTNPSKRLDAEHMKELIEEIAQVGGKKREIILVSSGAIGSGMGYLNLDHRPQDLADLQACAAIGQSHLMHLYNEYFRKHGRLTAQILLTQDDLEARSRYLNARNTLMRLLSMNVIPVVNENDTVAVNELRFGDNDTLGAQVCSLIEADLFIMLTNVDGLIHPGEKKVVDTIDKITAKLKKEFVKDEISALGVGGMNSKLDAAQIHALRKIATMKQSLK